jgi:hypothetical protein
MKKILFLVFIAVLVSGCMIGDGERDYAMSHITPTATQSSLTSPSAISTSTPIPPSGYWIRIEPISNKQAGEIFTINATTNLSAGEKILVQIYQANFHPGLHPDGFHGIAGTVNVMPGRNEINTISFMVNSSELYSYPLEYRVTEDAIYNDSIGNVQSNATGGARFKITPGKAS